MFQLFYIKITIKIYTKNPYRKNITKSLNQLIFIHVKNLAAHQHYTVLNKIKSKLTEDR